MSPPKLSIKTEELRTGGMEAPAAIGMGMEKLEYGPSLVEYDLELIKQFGLVSSNAVVLTLRGALLDDTTTTPMMISVRGMFTELDFGKFKTGDKAVLQCKWRAVIINWKLTANHWWKLT